MKEEVKNEQITTNVETEEAKQENTNKNPRIVKGVVTNCVKLNIRKEPSTDSEVVTIVDRDTEMDIFMNGSTKDFYKTNRGYVVKKFIKIVAK